MCLSHRWARDVSADGRITYVCRHCRHAVDWTAAREELDRIRREGGEIGTQPEVVQYDPTAGTIDTPAGPAKFVQFDPARGVVVVEVGYEHLVEFDASRCYVPVPIGGRGAA